jgi:hypothetical protein
MIIDGTSAALSVQVTTVTPLRGACPLIQINSIDSATGKRPNRRVRRLRQMGHDGDVTGMRMHRWRNSQNTPANRAMPNAWFDELDSTTWPPLRPEFCLM